MLAATQLAAGLFDEPVATFTRDFQVTADVPWYTGSVSVLTGMVWAAGAALAFLVAWLDPQERRRLGALALFVLVLAADDALLLHDAIGPRNGIPQEAFLVAYAVAAAALLVLFLRGPDRGVTVAFFLGGALLGVSAALDQVLPGLHLAEDGAKLLGALVWLVVPILAARRRVISVDCAGHLAPAP